MNFKIDLSKGFKNLDGTTNEDGDSMGKQLGTILGMSTGEKGVDSVKVYSIAVDLNKKGIVYLDASDRKLIRNLVDGLQIGHAVKAQLLIAIDGAKEKK